MKLTYTNQIFYSENGKHTEKYPIGEIVNFEQTKKFFDDLFKDSKDVKDIEFVDIGKKSIIRAKFCYGPFNECPIKFEIESDYSKKFETHQLLNCVLGALSKNSAYFIETKNNEIKIGKMLEVM